MFFKKFSVDAKIDDLPKYSSSKKKRSTPIYFNANYRREMKLVPIFMDYCLL